MKPYTLVEDKWRITANRLSYALEEKVLYKNGKSAWRPYGWYQSIDSLLRSWAELAIRESDADLHTALKETTWKLSRLKRELEVDPK